MTSLIMDVYSVNLDDARELEKQTFIVELGKEYKVKPEFKVESIVVREYQHDK